MSYEFGPDIEYVKVADDTGSHGRTRAALHETSKMLAEENAPVALHEALHEIISGDVGSRTMLNEFELAGRLLLGVSLDRNHQVIQPYDGLLYAEGYEPEDSGSFGQVWLHSWVRRRITEHGWTFGGTSLKELLVSHALREDDGGLQWGLQIDRLSHITIKDTEFGFPESYIYGHQRDLTNVEALSVPDELKTLFVGLTKAYHQNELRT